MSQNCIHCIKRERTGPDLLCDVCRANNLPPQPSGVIIISEPQDRELEALNNQQLSPYWQRAAERGRLDLNRPKKSMLELPD